MRSRSCPASSAATEQATSRGSYRSRFADPGHSAALLFGTMPISPRSGSVGVSGVRLGLTNDIVVIVSPDSDAPSRSANSCSCLGGAVTKTLGTLRWRSPAGHLSPSRRSDLGVCSSAFGAYGVLPPKSMESQSEGQQTPRLTSANANLLTPHHGVFARSSLSRLLVAPDTADFGPIWGAGVDAATLVHAGQRLAELRTRPQVLGGALKLTAWGPSAPKRARQG